MGAGLPFQEAFEYACDDRNEACWYELRDSLLIDAIALSEGRSRLEGKLARGNFNFRHVDLAVNVVGTGVLDCANNPLPSCYGSGFVEYDLEHNAFGIPVIDFLGVGRQFNFGQGAIRRGKALTSERFITLPLGSADASLVSEPSITKVELSGRPLSGEYRLKIYDSPALTWNRVEDVQLVLKYRYWSRVRREADE